MANYGDKGWIKLWRSEMNNPLYFSEPFTKWQAWIDLCMRADSSGTVKTSLEALKNQWLWGSRMTVSRFLVTLCDTGLVTVKSIRNKGTLIRINTRNSAKNNRGKKHGNVTVDETVSVNEELLPKEVDRASFEVSPSNNNYKQLNEELDDEYK